MYDHHYHYVRNIQAACGAGGFLFANFADDGEHSLAEANVYYTRLAEPIGKLWATNPAGQEVSFPHVALCT